MDKTDIKTDADADVVRIELEERTERVYDGKKEALPFTSGGEERTDGKKPSKLSTCMVVTKLLPEYFDWTCDELADVVSGDYVKVARTMVKRLNGENGDVVTDAYVILHDRDTKTEIDTENGLPKIVPADAHIHLLLKFNGRPYTLGEIASAVGLPENDIEKPRSGKYSYDNMCAYLIHIKYKTKTQYSPIDVITLAGTDYMTLYADREKSWNRGRASITAKNSRADKDWLVHELGWGNITLADVLNDDELFDIYLYNKTECDKAVDARNSRRISKGLRGILNHEFNKTVFYVSGPSGNGKSYFTANIAEKICEIMAEHGENWTVYRAGADNPFDAYDGSEIVIMDDVKTNTMSAENWTHFMDPEHAIQNSARYKNHVVPARVIIINGLVGPAEFFNYLKDIGGADRDETVPQYFRRIAEMIRIIKYDDDKRVYDMGDMRELKDGSAVTYRVNGGTDKKTGKKRDDIYVKFKYVHDANAERLSYNDAVKRAVYTAVKQFVPDFPKPDVTPLDGYEPDPAIVSYDPNFVPNTGPGEKNEYFDDDYNPSPKLLEMEREREEQMTNENGDPIF